MTAFEWGRQAAHDWGSVEKLLTPAQTIQLHKRETLEQLVSRRVDFLTSYQNAAYAAEFQRVVQQVQQAEAPLGKHALTEAVARTLFKLMAYKDEYEVARLHTDPAFEHKLSLMFEGNYTLNHHLAPPLFAKKNAHGELVKRKYGPLMHRAFRLLAKFKGLRGTAFDLFGYSAERRMERQLVADYQATVAELLGKLGAHNHKQAVELAQIPQQIKGFGHVKERNLRVARTQWDAARTKWQLGL
jgi:indolepyruvate ferredoxin oxidoreductase